MSNKRDRAWRRCQRARHINNRVENDLVPRVESVWPTAIWQLHTPHGEPMPFFKREAGGPGTVKKIGDTVVVKLRHEYGCPHYKPEKWFNHVLKAWVRPEYVPTSTSCGPKCAPYPGPSPSAHWWHPWPAAPVGFVWRLIRFTDPQSKEFAEGKLAKWRRPKGKWSFTSATGRQHAVSVGERKNWKLLYTRHVKVYRASKLGFQYGILRRHAIENED